MIHSGSRNLGKRICDTFNDIAIELNEKYYSQVHESIPFLPMNSEEGKEYWIYMNFALDFAYLNRSIMLSYIQKDITHAFSHMTIKFDDSINIHHNYASRENHFGKNVVVHRKGSTLATEKTIGIIPGSMATKSFIVRGKGNPDSYMSCSHGSGRKMGRKAFNREFNTPEKMKEIEESLKNVVHTSFSKQHSFKKNKETGLLDVSEAPQAYKNSKSVISCQSDLIEILTTLTPIINGKC